MSSSWWASSMTSSSHSGMTSPKLCWRMAASAHSRWWLTTTRSASAASWRMVVMKHSLYCWHELPMQFSVLAETSFQNDTSSGNSSISARSPDRVVPDHSSTSVSAMRSAADLITGCSLNCVQRCLQR